MYQSTVIQYIQYNLSCVQQGTPTSEEREGDGRITRVKGQKKSRVIEKAERERETDNGV